MERQSDYSANIERAYIAVERSYARQLNQAEAKLTQKKKRRKASDKTTAKLKKTISRKNSEIHDWEVWCYGEPHDEC